MTDQEILRAIHADVGMIKTDVAVMKTNNVHLREKVEHNTDQISEIRKNIKPGFLESIPRLWTFALGVLFCAAAFFLTFKDQILGK
jgi:hypothetical protein